MIWSSWPVFNNKHIAPIHSSEALTHNHIFRRQRTHAINVLEIDENDHYILQDSSKLYFLSNGPTLVNNVFYFVRLANYPFKRLSNSEIQPDHLNVAMHWVTKVCFYSEHARVTESHYSRIVFVGAPWDLPANRELSLKTDTPCRQCLVIGWVVNHKPFFEAWRQTVYIFSMFGWEWG